MRGPGAKAQARSRHIAERLGRGCYSVQPRVMGPNRASDIASPIAIPVSRSRILFEPCVIGHDQLAELFDLTGVGIAQLVCAVGHVR